MSELEPPPADDSEGSPASPPEAAETAASPRKRTRRSAPRKTAAPDAGVESDGTGALEASEAVSPDIEVAEAPPAPARRSRRRKAAEPAPAEDAPAEAAPSAEVTPSAPDDAPPAATDEPALAPAPDGPTADTTPQTEETLTSPPGDSAPAGEKPSRRRGRAAGTPARRRSRQPLAAAVEAEAVADALETGGEELAPDAPPVPDSASPEDPPTAAALPDTAEPELTDVEEFPAAEVGAEDLPDPAAGTEGAETTPEAVAPDATESSEETEAAGAPVRKRRRERRRTRPKKETAPPEAEGDEATPEEGAGTLAPASEDGEEAPPELVAEETELLSAVDLPAGATEEAAESDGEDADEGEDEGDENGAESAEGESAASRNRKRRRRRRRRSGLTLREEAPPDQVSEPDTPTPAMADAEAELLSAETGADLETVEDVEAGIDEGEDEGADEDDEPTAAPSEDGSAAERRARRSRFPNRRDGRRRPAMEQAVIENPSDPAGSPLRVDIQPGVGSRLIGRSIIGFREAYDIGGGDRAAVSFHVMVLDDGSQWRLKGSEEFDPWVERILPGEED